MNLKCYVGITRLSLDERWTKHLRNAKEGRPGHFYNAIRRYGASAFTPTFLSHALNWEELCELEIYFITKYHSNDRQYGYNMTAGGEGVTATDEVREKIKAKKTGKICPDEVRKRISVSLKGRKVGINATPRPSIWKQTRNERRREARRKLREAGLVKWGGRRTKTTNT